MVFCKDCGRKVDPIQARIRVFDERSKVRVLETFKSGQVWQLSGLPTGVYSEKHCLDVFRDFHIFRD